MTHATTSGEVVGLESDYIDSSDLGSYEDTIYGFDTEDARRHKSNKMCYNPNAPFEDFLFSRS